MVLDGSLPCEQQPARDSCSKPGDSTVSKRFLLFQLMHNNYKIIGMLKTIKIPTIAHLHNRLVCRHNIDHVINYEHNRIIIVVLAKHEIAP